ncbi:hypothetical protein [Lentzea sp. HUAS12]|uniref:hypothetical protein n=1 Tax=Lentzea sp. HUAS12 TaxID=2951806 RepID=UPI00209F9CC1|nr:hypothetical protein [Lentzea sp. HUAS12]USX49329.1 hypothetical protein ND450_28270 [Lentzea sp. HUAS12]
MLVDEHTQRGHQSRNFVPCHEQRGRTITVSSNPRHKIQMLDKPSAQLGKQDVVAHDRTPFD